MKRILMLSGGLLIMALGGAGWLHAAAIPQPWTVVTGESELAFGSIKNSAIAEVHTLSDITGTVTHSGQFSLSLGLGSVDTGIDIRNTRMQELLFETALYPTVAVTGSFDPKDFMNMSVGARKITTLPVRVSLHNIEQTRDIEISVVRLARNKVLVSSTKPVMIEVGDFNLRDGLEKLRAVAGLISIAEASPVTFAIVFENRGAASRY